MNDTKKITLTSFCALLLGFAGLFLYVEFFESTLFSDSTNDSETTVTSSNIKKIFLVGGSNTVTLNPDHIDDYLSDNGFHQYRVYNLGSIYDSPTLRLDQIDLLISSEPTVVLYGLGFRGLGYQHPDTRHLCSNQKELIGDYLNVLQKELSRDENTLTFLPTDNEILPAVKDISKYFEQSFQNQLDVFSSFANPKHVTVNVLRIVLEESDTTDKSKRSIPGQIDNRLTHLASLNRFSNIISLEETNKPMFEGRINVCPEDLNRELATLKGIISKLQENNVDVLLFFTPYAQSYLNAVGESEVSKLINVVERFSVENNVKFESLHNDYVELEIWNDWAHIAKNPDTLIYSNDVAEFILKNLDPYTNLRTVDITKDNLSFIDLSNSDLRGADLSYKNLTGTDLSNSNLQGANLVGTILKGTNLSYVNLRNSDLSGQDLSETILVGADLVGANLKDVSLAGTDLTAADLTESDLLNKDL